MIYGLHSFGDNKIRGLAKIIQMYCRKNMSEVFRDIFLNVSLDNEDTLYYLSRLEKSLRSGIQCRPNYRELRKCIDVLSPHGDWATEIKFLYSHRVPRLSQIEAELNSVHKIYDNISFENNNSICVIIGPFIIRDINFGKFKIYFPMCNFLSPCYSVSAIRAKAINPNRAIHDERIIHPHISERNICLGDGQDAVYTALQEFRLVDALDVINSVLNTYNERDPYAKIEYWSGQLCKSCDALLEPDYDLIPCPKCGIKYCKSCIIKCCDALPEPVCYNCVNKNFKCRRCGSIRCGECVEVCERCKRTFCKCCKENYHDCYHDR